MLPLFGIETFATAETPRGIRLVVEKLTGCYSRRPALYALLFSLLVFAGLLGVHAILGFTPAFRSLYVVPIWLATRLGGRTIGAAMVLVATLTNSAFDYFLMRSVSPTFLLSESLIRFAAFGAIMLLIAQIEEALQRHRTMSLHDPLTGLLNRRALQEFATQAVGRAKRAEEPLVVLMIDCDDFKRLNDRFGHLAGDHVLKILARTLVSETRSSDLVSRLGGDEFVVVLQNSDEAEAFNVIARVQHVFEASVRDAGYGASLSVGYAALERADHTMETLLYQADRAMYTAKAKKKARAYLN